MFQKLSHVMFDHIVLEFMLICLRVGLYLIFGETVKCQRFQIHLLSLFLCLSLLGFPFYSSEGICFSCNPLMLYWSPPWLWSGVKKGTCCIILGLHFSGPVLRAIIITGVNPIEQFFFL